MLLAALLFWFILKLMKVRAGCCNTVRNFLKTKLFYSVWIRYMIESNLKITHNCIFFLAMGASFDSVDDSYATAIQIILFVIICIWPFFAVVFLCLKRKKLEDRSFKTKCGSMYNGLKTYANGALLYTSIFCIRRFLLVVALLRMQKQQAWLVLLFNTIQTFYFAYMTLVMPH